MSAVNVDYTSKDFDGFKASMLEYARLNWPAWTGRNEADFGVMMVELMAYMGDILSYYGDRIQAEAYMPTATQRQSVLNLSALLGYIPSGNIAATCSAISFTNTSGGGITVPAGTQVMTDLVPALDRPIFFETDTDLFLAAGATSSITATEGRTIGVVPSLSVPGTSVASSDGTLDQSFLIDNYPVIDGTVRVFGDQSEPLLVATTPYEEYTQFDYLLSAGPNDRAFTATTDSNGVVTITFGDGINGFVPPAGTRYYTTYRVGGGVAGNIAISAITGISSAIPNIVLGSPSNAAATGGADQESIDQIRTNAPLAYQTQDRAVTLSDFGNLALGVASVFRANAMANTYSNVSVFILGPNGSQPVQALKDAVKIYLDTRKMVGTTVSVAAGTGVPVNLGTALLPVTLGVKDAYSRTAVKAAVSQALTTYFSAANTDFAQRVPVSDMYTVLATVPGVAYGAITVMARNDLAQTGVNDAVMQPWEIPTAGTFYLTATGGTA